MFRAALTLAALVLVVGAVALALGTSPESPPDPGTVRTSPEAVEATYTGSKAEWVALNPGLSDIQIARVCNVTDERGARLADSLDERFPVELVARLRSACS